MELDPNIIKKRRTIQLFIYRIIATISAIIMAIFLILIAMGYRLDKDGNIKQAGMLRIHSLPTGANITINNKLISAHTNTSQMLSAGDQTIKLTKEGYDSWQKTTSIIPGFFQTFSTPRLFLKKPVKHHLATFKKSSFFSLSPDQKELLVITASPLLATTKTNPAEIAVLAPPDRPKPTPLLYRAEIHQLQPENLRTFPLVTLPDIPLSAYWSKDQRNLLITSKQVSYLVDKKTKQLTPIKIPDQTPHLTPFSSDLKTLLATNPKQPHLLSELNISNQTSTPITKNLLSFQIFRHELFYLEKHRSTIIRTTADTTPNNHPPSTQTTYRLFFKKPGEPQELIASFDYPFEFAVHEYEGKKYLLQKKDQEVKFSALEVKLFDNSPFDIKENFTANLNYPLKNPAFSDSGRFLSFFDPSKTQSLVLDFDRSYKRSNCLIDNYQLPIRSPYWLDDLSILNIEQNSLFIRDFDGENKRKIATLAPHTPVALTKDNKYLYLFQASKQNPENLDLFSYQISK